MSEILQWAAGSGAKGFVRKTPAEVGRSCERFEVRKGHIYIIVGVPFSMEGDSDVTKFYDHPACGFHWDSGTVVPLVEGTLGTLKCPMPGCDTLVMVQEVVTEP